MPGRRALGRTVSVGGFAGRGEAAPAARGVRLHRRRRRCASHAARELPRVRGHDVPARVARSPPGRRSDDDRPRHAARAAHPPRRRSAAAGCSIRAARKSRRAAPARRGRSTSFRRCRAARLEDVEAATRGPVWYQLYLVGGRDVAARRIERAKRRAISALVVTIDTPVAGLRERDLATA